MRACIAAAAAATAAATFWIGVNVAGNYGGRLNGTFYTGTDVPLPPALERDTYRVADARGYDGQYYHIIAHDPLNRRGFIPWVDNPSLRWRRIGVPALAAMAPSGLVDHAYVAIQLSFVFLGVFWLAQYARAAGRSAAWGLAFFAIPAVLVSLDRMTVDLGLAALVIGLLRYAGRGRPVWPVCAILTAAPLVRETGMLLVAGWVAHALWTRRWHSAAWGVACAVPATAWWVYVAARTPADGTAWLSSYPFSGLIARTAGGFHAPQLRLVAGLENLALAGIWAALGCVLYLVWTRRFGVLEITAALFAGFAGTLGRFDIWADAYAAGRTMSPLLVLVALVALRDRRVIFALPVAMVLPRILLQYWAQLKGVL